MVFIAIIFAGPILLFIAPSWRNAWLATVLFVALFALGSAFATIGNVSDIIVGALVLIPLVAGLNFGAVALARRLRSSTT